MTPEARADHALLFSQKDLTEPTKPRKRVSFQDGPEVVNTAGQVVQPSPPGSQDGLQRTPSDASSVRSMAKRSGYVDSLKSCIAGLATHIYYNDQIPDMVSAIQQRLGPYPSHTEDILAQIFEGREEGLRARVLDEISSRREEKKARSPRLSRASGPKGIPVVAAVVSPLGPRVGAEREVAPPRRAKFDVFAMLASLQLRPDTHIMARPPY